MFVSYLPLISFFLSFFAWYEGLIAVKISVLLLGCEVALVVWWCACHWPQKSRVRTRDVRQLQLRCWATI
jgi:hypothetical protein